MSDQHNPAQAAWRVAEMPMRDWPIHSGDLPDLNVWLALTVAEHPFHADAMAYWQSTVALGNTLWFCRTTMLGLVRLLAQPKVMGAGVLTLPDAMQTYQKWRSLSCVASLPEPAEVDTSLTALLGTSAAPLPSRLWTDVWLAAMASSSGLRLVTFDEDFRRFDLPRVEILQRGS